MISFLGPILSYILLYKYPVLFAAQYLAALIVPFPANTTLAAIGAFASEGYMSFSVSFLIALAGSVLGDVTGYLIARFLRERINRWVKRSQRWSRYLDRLDRAIRRYAGATIAVTRLIPALEIIVNFLAGLADVPAPRFIMWDIVGNTANNFIYMGIGYLIGADWQNLIGAIGLVGGILLVLALIAITFVFYRIVVMGKFKTRDL